jgi:glycosyltransferase involved in cell wall biosynthesis
MDDHLTSDADSERPRVLLLGPAFPPSSVGGLQLALKDVVTQLRSCGWLVDSYVDAETNYADSTTTSAQLQTTVFRSSLSRLARWKFFLSIWHLFPYSRRSAIAVFFKPYQFFYNTSYNLYKIESILAMSCEKRDIVLLCVDVSPPGVVSLVTSLHQRVIIISLKGLTDELKASSWNWVRYFGRIRLGTQMHPFFFQRVKVSQIKCAVFASQKWWSAAVRAGLPEGTARTIYFGIPIAEPLPGPTVFKGRILWVGRLCAEKGLHLLLQALPGIRTQVKQVNLTVIAAKGPAEYRQRILDMIVEYKLEDIVTIRPPVAREVLQEVYADHDILFFFSQFSEAVALVLMEAFAAGLPVIASQRGDDAVLVQDDVTCLCYQPRSQASLVHAVMRMFSDAALRDRLALNAQKLVQQEFSLDAMGRAYDELLCQFIQENG